MSLYLPDGCTQDALDRYYGYDVPDEGDDPDNVPVVAEVTFDDGKPATKEPCPF